MNDRNSLPSVVLMYHRIGSPLVRSVVRGQYVTPFLLRRQLAAMLAQGYRPVTLGGLLSRGEYAGQFAVTFDDGYSSVRQPAYPILAEMGIRATVYVVAGAVGKTNEWDERIGDRTETILTADDLRELSAAGFEIGSHGMAHAHLTDLSDTELKTEVAESRRVLEDIIGAPVTGFSYPYGEWDARVRDAVMEAGYEYAVSTGKGILDPSADRFALPRLNVRWNNVPSVLLRKVRAGGAGCFVHEHPTPNT